MNSIFEFIWVVFHPSFWLMNKKYSRVWDEKLLSLMKTHEFTDIGKYEAKIVGTTIWIANYPYASFTYNDLRPSRKTIKLAMEKLEHDLFEQKFK